MGGLSVSIDVAAAKAWYDKATMPDLTYASWVEGTAKVLDSDRGAVVAFVRGVAPAFWDRPSPVEGWANRDLLAHLAGGNDQLLQTLLRAATGRTQLDPGALSLDTDEENAVRIEQRRAWTIEQLIAELERDGAEVQLLLANLRVEDEAKRFEGFDLTLGQFLRIVLRERHDHEHLQQLGAVDV
jgi:uncharacterized protein (TIGR03083 family)